MSSWNGLQVLYELPVQAVDQDYVDQGFRGFVMELCQAGEANSLSPVLQQHVCESFPTS